MGIKRYELSEHSGFGSRHFCRESGPIGRSAADIGEQLLEGGAVHIAA